MGTSSAIGVPSYPASSSPVLSTMTISTCVPTVIYSTVTVTPTAPALLTPQHHLLPVSSHTPTTSPTQLPLLPQLLSLELLPTSKAQSSWLPSLVSLLSSSHKSSLAYEA